jgi:hypothetical protein
LRGGAEVSPRQHLPGHHPGGLRAADPPRYPVGAHRLDVLKDGYGPYTTTVTVVKDQTAPVTATLSNDDLDGDGLPDGFENGYRDGFGNWHILDPDTVDTDDDGMLDGKDDQSLVSADPASDLVLERLRPEVALRPGGIFR